VKQFLDAHAEIEQVTFCCFGSSAMELYECEVAKRSGAKG
jgi:hypothetical protein